MSLSREIKKWQEGRVDRSKEYFELRYGSAADGAWDDWTPIALIGPPIEGIVDVEFLVEPRAENSEGVRNAKKEIQYYLIDKQEQDPWAYARYHCGTGANVYSNIHWSFFNSERTPQ